MLLTIILNPISGTILHINRTKMHSAAGLRPDPLGELSTPSRPCSWIYGGLFLREEEGRGDRKEGRGHKRGGKE